MSSDELRRQLRHSLRLMRKSPGFTATALATLALCLGANLTIFAVVDAILLRPLPFPDADRLVRIFNTYPRAGVMDDGASVTNYYERRGRIAALPSLALYREGTAIVGDTGSTEREQVVRVSPDFFATLGRGPVIGRAFTDEETTFETDDVVILTDAYWRQRLGADPNAIGRRIRVDGAETTVVGVLPPDFRFLSSRARLYFPRASDAEARSPARRHSGSLSQMVARLADGVSAAEAQSQVDAHNAAVGADSPEAKMMADAGFRSVVVPLRADHVAAIRPTLLLIQAGALVLLAIGAVNLVNLLLIRASGRLRELAVRHAIGASRHHVVGEVVVDTMLLALAGATLGLGAGAAGIRLLDVLGTGRLPLGTQVAFDARVAGIAFAAAIAVGIALAIPIAWYSLRAHEAGMLTGESRGGTANRAAQQMRHAFLVAQIALAFVLLSGAGLLGVSLQRALAVSPGFQAENILTGQISLPGAPYRTGAARIAFTDRLVDAISQQPGVVAAGVVTNIPFSGITIKSAARVKGYVMRPGESLRGHYSYGVTGDYFRALGVGLVEGRLLTSADSRAAMRVCVVDDDFARVYWPRGGAVGQQLFQGGEEGADADAFTIVGVVRAAKQAGLTDREAQGAIFYPYGHRLDRDIFVVTRTTAAPQTFAATLRQVTRTIDADLPVNDVQPMDARIAASVVERRSPAVLAALFAGLAVLLTAIGTYGVVSYGVAQRRREIGVRMALGARPGQIRRQFVSVSLRLIAIGAGIGVAGAWLAGRTMQSLLFDVPALHVVTLAGTLMVMSAVCLAACLIPSGRAARISPMEALADD